jgi:hypothetical protein
MARVDDDDAITVTADADSNTVEADLASNVPGTIEGFGQSVALLPSLLAATRDAMAEIVDATRGHCEGLLQLATCCTSIPTPPRYDPLMAATVVMGACPSEGMRYAVRTVPPVERTDSIALSRVAGASICDAKVDASA